MPSSKAADNNAASAGGATVVPRPRVVSLASAHVMARSSAAVTARERMRGAVLIEHALIMPLLVVAAFAALLYCVYAVSQFALQGDVARVAERAVRVAPVSSASAYCAAVDAFVRRAFEDSDPFYAAYVKDLRVTGITVARAPGADGRQVLTVTRSGDFKLLASHALGLPLTLSASASALLPRAEMRGQCAAAA